MNDKLEEIAKQYLNVETLKTRNSDELDFYDVPIWMIKKALEEAYQTGKDDGFISGQNNMLEAGYSLE